MELDWPGQGMSIGGGALENAGKGGGCWGAGQGNG